MVVVLLIMNRFLPFNVYSRTSALKLIIINGVVGGIIYITVSFKMGIPNHIFGGKELSRVIKKLTFGKFQIKEK